MRNKLSFYYRHKMFTLTLVEVSFGAVSFWLIGGSIKGADVDETDDVRIWLSSSSACFFTGAWESKRCDRKSYEWRCWFPTDRAK